MELLDLPKGKCILRRELLEGPAASGVRLLPGLGLAVSFAGRGLGEAEGSLGDDVLGGGEVARPEDDDALTAVGEMLRTEDAVGATPLLVGCTGAVSAGICTGSGAGNAWAWFGVWFSPFVDTSKASSKESGTAVDLVVEIGEVAGKPKPSSKAGDTIGATIEGIALSVELVFSWENEAWLKSNVSSNRSNVNVWVVGAALVVGGVRPRASSNALMGEVPLTH